MDLPTSGKEHMLKVRVPPRRRRLTALARAQALALCLCCQHVTEEDFHPLHGVVAVPQLLLPVLPQTHRSWGGCQSDLPPTKMKVHCLNQIIISLASA